MINIWLIKYVCLFPNIIFSNICMKERLKNVSKNSALLSICIFDHKTIHFILTRFICQALFIFLHKPLLRIYTRKYNMRTIYTDYIRSWILASDILRLHLLSFVIGS